MIELRVTLSDEQMAQIVEQVADVLEARQAEASQPASRWLTVDQAAGYIGARPQRIYDLRSSGRLSRCGDGGRALVDRRELDALVERGV